MIDYPDGTIGVMTAHGFDPRPTSADDDAPRYVVEDGELFLLPTPPQQPQRDMQIYLHLAAAMELLGIDDE